MQEQFIQQPLSPESKSVIGDLATNLSQIDLMFKFHQGSEEVREALNSEQGRIELSNIAETAQLDPVVSPIAQTMHDIRVGFNICCGKIDSWVSVFLETSREINDHSVLSDRELAMTFKGQDDWSVVYFDLYNQHSSKPFIWRVTCVNGVQDLSEVSVCDYGEVVSAVNALRHGLTFFRSKN